jgi:hypothetical protein
MDGLGNDQVSPETVSPFAGDRASRLARWLVLEMMLWPGLLFVFVTGLIVYAVRDQPLLWPVVALYLLATFAAARQWRVMIRAVVSPSPPQRAKEASPRLTGRGTTEADR